MTIKIQESFDNKYFKNSGFLTIDDEQIFYNGMKDSTLQEYKKGVKKVLLGVKRKISLLPQAKR